IVVEDDFGFTDDIELHKKTLAEFFHRQYQFDICLLSSSKHGRIAPKDDLVSLPRQQCTNAHGYILSREGINKVVGCWSDALRSLIQTGDTLRFAVDRCWSALQGERFLVFKTGMGFQVPSYSDIEGVVSADFVQHSRERAFGV